MRTFHAFGLRPPAAEERLDRFAVRFSSWVVMSRCHACAKNRGVDLVPHTYDWIQLVVHLGFVNQRLSMALFFGWWNSGECGSGVTGKRSTSSKPAPVHLVGTQESLTFYGVESGIDHSLER